MAISPGVGRHARDTTFTTGRNLMNKKLVAELVESMTRMKGIARGERASAALRTRVTRANPKRSTAELRGALKESLKEEAAGKGRSFQSGREAMRWLGN
jgi:hypothetical protein